MFNYRPEPVNGRLTVVYYALGTAGYVLAPTIVAPDGTALAFAWGDLNAGTLHLASSLAVHHLTEACRLPPHEAVSLVVEKGLSRPLAIALLAPLPAHDDQWVINTDDVAAALRAASAGVPDPTCFASASAQPLPPAPDWLAW